MTDKHFVQRSIEVKIGKTITAKPLETIRIETDKTYHYVVLQFTKCPNKLKDGIHKIIVFTRERDTLVT